MARMRQGAGRRRSYITIQQETVTYDANRQPSYAWSTFMADVPASFMRVNAGEMIRENVQVQAGVTVVFQCYYLAGVDTDMRVSYNGRTYGIVAADDPTDETRELIIQCKAVV